MHIVDLSDTDYCGSLSLMRAIPQSSKRGRGKVRGNKTTPRERTIGLTPVTDEEGNIVKVSRTRRTSTTPRVVAASQDNRGRYFELLRIAGTNSDAD